MQATDAASGDGVSNVSLLIAPANEQMREMGVKSKKEKAKKTAKGGGANYKSMNDGDYIVSASKPGFKDITVMISVVNGESSALEIRMEKV